MRLVPNNWLYNAGLVGLIRVLQAKGVDVIDRLSDDGFELRAEDFDGFADAYCKCVLQADSSVGRFIPWLKEEQRKFLNSFGANYAEMHNEYLERLRQELSVIDTVEQAEHSVRVAVNTFAVEVMRHVEQGLEAQRQQLAQSTPQNKSEQKELDRRSKSVERDGTRAKKIVEEIRNTTGYLETQKYIVNVLRRFYFNKGVIAQYNIATDKTRVRQFEEMYVVPAANSLGLSNIQDAVPCRFCFRPSVNLGKRWKEDSVFNEGMFSISGISVKHFTNFFYNLIPDLFICDICELILLCAWTGFNQIPWQLRSGNKDTEYLFVNLPSLPLLFEQNNRVNATYQRNLLSVRDTIYEDVMTDLFSERRQRGQWVLQNVLFIEIRTADRKPGTGFKYFQIGKDVAELFTKAEAAKSFRRIKGRLAAPGDKKRVYSLQLKREVVKRFLSGDQVYDLAYQVCHQSLDNRLLRARNAIEIVFLHSLRRQIWRGHSDKQGYNPKQKATEGRTMKPGQVYRILQGFSEAGARLANAATQDLKSPDEKLKKCQRMAYRLMSIVRSGKYAEFYDMLMKLYVDSGRPIPTNLLGLLNPNDDIEFEAKAYALLSGFLGESQPTNAPEGTDAEPPQGLQENPLEEEQVNG